MTRDPTRRARVLAAARAVAVTCALLLAGVGCGGGGGRSDANGQDGAPQVDDVRVDAANDALATMDGGRDTSDAGTACLNADVAAPGAFVPPHAAVDACTPAEIDEYFTACLDEATALPIRCQQYTAGHTACAQCLLPTDASHEAGALRAVAGGLEVNVGGCVALLLADASPTGCGARETAYYDCVRAACAGCDVGEDAACVASAREGVCRELAVQRCPELAGAAVCGLGGTFLERYRVVARVFCAAATDR